MLKQLYGQSDASDYWDVSSCRYETPGKGMTWSEWRHLPNLLFRVAQSNHGLYRTSGGAQITDKGRPRGRKEGEGGER